MLTTRHDLDRLAERLKESEEYRQAPERLDFSLGVMELLMRRREEGAGTPLPMTESGARLRLEAGFPLLDRLAALPDPGECLRTAQELLDLLEEAGTLDGEVIGAVRKSMASLDDPGSRVAAYARDGVLPTPAGDRLAPEIEEVWRYLLHGALKPFFERHALAWGALPPLGGWEQGTCPVCGSGPAMAGFLGEEGRRMLLCHWCGHLWNFARVKCPFCQTADHRQLRYLSFGAASPYRVDVCDHCRGYLKTADGRNIPGDLLLEAEDLLTPHLDLVAAREGFLRKAPGVLGLLR